MSCATPLRVGICGAFSEKLTVKHSQLLSSIFNFAAATTVDVFIHKLQHIKNTGGGGNFTGGARLFEK